MKLLIVDDSRAMRMIVRKTLRDAGIKPSSLKEAENGAAALVAIEAEQPDLILCDWNMPEMTGIELLEELQKRENPATFGFVTTEATGEMRDRAKAAGASFLMAKPFTPEDFARTLEPFFQT